MLFMHHAGMNSYLQCLYSWNGIFTSNVVYISTNNLEAFSVNNAGARLVVFLFRNPHLLEC